MATLAKKASATRAMKTVRIAARALRAVTPFSLSLRTNYVSGKSPLAGYAAAHKRSALSPDDCFYNTWNETMVCELSFFCTEDLSRISLLLNGSFFFDFG